jgi:hypothetical protein
MHKSASLRIRAFDLCMDFDVSVICPYNVCVMKRLLVSVLVVCLSFLVVCKKSPSTTTTSDTPKPGDTVEAKLQELAGSGATDCGRLKTQEAAAVQTASDCAMKAAESKHAFYVAYDLPGLTTAVAGNAQGNMFSIQAQTGTEGSAAGLESTACPAALRIAQSGRVTCYPPGSMNGMPTGASPHGGMGMPATTGKSPHGEIAAPSHGKPTTPQ